MRARLAVLIAATIATTTVPASAQDAVPSPLAEDATASARAAPEAGTLVAGPLPTGTPRGSRRRRYLIAAGEELVGLGLGAAWYWADREHNLADWDIRSIRQRFSVDSIRFDTNSMSINFLWHPLSGAAYYGLPRANGLSMPASVGYAFLTSLAWEYGLEFREKVSVNDVITTPITGIALGEFLTRFARYLNRIPGGGTNDQRSVGWVLGLVQAMHDAGYRPQPLSADVPRDALGYDARLWHRFELATGFGLLASPSSGAVPSATFAFDGELFAMPGHLTADRIRRGFADADRSSLSVRLTVGPGLGSTELRADAILAGGEWQRMRGEPGARRGYAVTLGSHVGYLYRHDVLRGFRDAIGATALPGLALEVDVVRPRVRFHLSTRVEGQFAGIHAAAYDTWAAQNPGVVTKHVLRSFDYYYGWGLAARATATLEMPLVTLQTSVFHARYRSQEGLDRSQETLMADIPGRDRALDVEARLRLRLLPRRGLFVELAAARRLRSDHLATLVVEQRLDRVGVVLGTVK